MRYVASVVGFITWKEFLRTDSGFWDWEGRSVLVPLGRLAEFLGKVCVARIGVLKDTSSPYSGAWRFKGENFTS